MKPLSLAEGTVFIVVHRVMNAKPGRHEWMIFVFREGNLLDVISRTAEVLICTSTGGFLMPYKRLVDGSKYRDVR